MYIGIRISPLTDTLCVSVGLQMPFMKACMKADTNCISLVWKFQRQMDTPLIISTKVFLIQCLPWVDPLLIHLLTLLNRFCRDVSDKQGYVSSYSELLFVEPEERRSTSAEKRSSLITDQKRSEYASDSPVASCVSNTDLCKVPEHACLDVQ
jgi:hypothetical protein